MLKIWNYYVIDIENIWFCVKIPKFHEKKNTTLPKMIILPNWADKVFIVMIWSFCQMEFDYFWFKNKWCFFCACWIFINSWKFAWKFVSNQQICLLLFGMTKKTKEDNLVTISINLCYVIPIFTFCFALGLKLIFLRYQVH